jgi:hypothetical protein
MCKHEWVCVVRMYMYMCMCVPMCVSEAIDLILFILLGVYYSPKESTEQLLVFEYVVVIGPDPPRSCSQFYSSRRKDQPLHIIVQSSHQSVPITCTSPPM